MALVEKAISIMGRPDEAEQYNEKDSTAASQSYRRIYRDPDNRILGGVCSGLGLYWRIDPVIFRLLFIIGTLIAFSGALIYLILWIAIPKSWKCAANQSLLKTSEKQ